MTVKIDGTNTVANPAFTGADTDTGLQCGTNEVNLVTGGTARATVDSSGNVGVGTTSPTEKLTVTGGNIQVDASDRKIGFKLSGNSNAGYLLPYTSAGNTELVNEKSNGNLIFKTANSERARLDSSGRLLVGTTSADSNTRLHVSAAENTSDPLATDASIVIANTQNAGNNEAAAIKFNVGNTNSASISAHYDSFNAGVNSSLRFYTQFQSAFNSPAERARITSNGVFLVGKTSQSYSTAGIELDPDDWITVTNNSLCLRLNRTNTTGEAAQFMYNGTIKGRITVSATSTAYTTTSDYRLKENVVNLDGAIDRVKQLAPKRFNFIVEPDVTVDGFLAHEAQTVVPEAITGTHNGVEVWKEDDELPEGVSVGDNKLDEDGNTIPDYQEIDQSKLVPLLTAALQEAIAKIETLETKVAALEATE